jgi:pilus assembly protein CpaB
MNWKTWIPLALAIVLGLAAAMIARSALNRNRVVGTPQPKTVKIVVIKGHAAPGQELTGDLLALGPIAADVPPPGAFSDVGQVVGRVAGTPMFNGQPVLEDLLTPRGAGTGLQALLPRGMRAITVAVDETSGLAGLLMPGSRVDVISTLNGSNKDETLAATIVQDVLVQAVGQRLAAQPPVEKDAQAARTVTLVVSPRDAEAIELASSMGRTRLVLRGMNDRGQADSVGVTVVQLRGIDKERPGMPVVVVNTPPVSVPTTNPVEPKTGLAGDPFSEEARPKRTVTVFRGGAKTEVVFDSPDVKPETAVTKTSNEPTAE